MAVNFRKLESKSLFKEEYAYIDVPEYLADQLFINEKIKVDFKATYSKEGFPYVIVYCKIYKKDRNKFIHAMERLTPKMILFDHSDYNEYCIELWDKVGFKDTDCKSVQ